MGLLPQRGEGARMGRVCDPLTCHRGLPSWTFMCGAKCGGLVEAVPPSPEGVLDCSSEGKAHLPLLCPPAALLFCTFFSHQMGEAVFHDEIGQFPLLFIFCSVLHIRTESQPGCWLLLEGKIRIF